MKAARRTREESRLRQIFRGLVFDGVKILRTEPRRIRFSLQIPCEQAVNAMWIDPRGIYHLER
jgi:hypothetical protein